MTAKMPYKCFVLSCRTGTDNIKNLLFKVTVVINLFYYFIDLKSIFFFFVIITLF